MGKIRSFILIFAVFFIFWPTTGNAEPGDSLWHLEKKYGPYRLVEDTEGRYWTKEQWQARPNSEVKAKKYGYITTAGDLDVAIWAELDNRMLVAHELYIPYHSLEFQNFKRNFESIYGKAKNPDSISFTIYSNSLSEADWGVIFRESGNNYYFIRFMLADSRIKAFEISKVKAGDINRLLSSDKGIEQWVTGANLLQPDLKFVEKLIRRKKTDMLVIHHTATNKLFVEDVHQMHLHNGWAGIGYHKLILPSGIIEDGRPENAIGAHAYGVNDRSIGIALVGNFEKHPPTQLQMESLISLVKKLAGKYRIEPRNIVPHRDVSDTICPGRFFPWDTFKKALD